MTQYIIRRLIQAIPILLGVSMLLFAILHFVPGGPLAMYMNNPRMTAEQLERVKHAFGLDKPLYMQYLAWLGNLLHGNFGTSFATGEDVLVRIQQRLPATIELMGSSFLLALVLAIPIGVLSAVKQYSLVDYATTFFSYLGIAMPTFWMAIIMIIVFSAKLHWFPATGAATPGVHSLADRLDHLVMPTIVLAFYTLASWSRYIRASMLGVIRQDYVRTARAKGLKERVVIFRHALKNALLPAVTVIALDGAYLFSGALITETVFSWPGMGRLFWDSVTKRDYPMLMGILVLASFLIILFNLIADVLYGILDPRVRYD